MQETELILRNEEFYFFDVKRKRFRRINGERVPSSAFLIALLSFLRISNLLPYSLADLHSNKAYFLNRQDGFFTTSGAVLRIYRTKNNQSHQRELEIPLQFMPNSALCPVLFKIWHLIQKQPSLWQIFKDPPLISFLRGKISQRHARELNKPNTPRKSELLRSSVAL